MFEDSPFSVGDVGDFDTCVASVTAVGNWAVAIIDYGVVVIPLYP